MSLPVTQDDNGAFMRFQVRWKSVLDSFVDNPFLNGSILQNVTLNVGQTAVNHGLGRNLQGWVMTRLFSPTTNQQPPIAWSTYGSFITGVQIGVTAAGASLIVGNTYVITTVGTTTAAQWITLGVPVGVTAAAGVYFIAAATGAGAGTGQVESPLAPVIYDLQNFNSTPNLTLNLISSAAVVVNLYVY